MEAARRLRREDLLSRDPARSDGVESPCRYCAGDPVAGVDPDGERVQAVAAYALKGAPHGDGTWSGF